MFFLQKIFYELLVRASVTGAWAGSFFFKRPKNWLAARRDWRENLRANWPQSAIRNPQSAIVSPTLWVHCASLGEFEQGRPVIEGFKKENPGWRVVLTFFSNSGFDQRKDWPGADLVALLPADLPANARDFLDIVRPDLALFVKNEFWPAHLFELKRRGVPTALVSAVFRKGQPFFHPLGGFWRRMLGCFDHVFVQNRESAELLKSTGFDKTTVAGDTRIDRVLGIAAESRRLPVVERFLDGSPAITCGSTWEVDEKVLAPIFQLVENQGLKLIVAPHELSEGAFRRLEKICPGPVVRYSFLEKNRDTAAAKTLLIDNIGLLSAIYFYGKIAYIGGGFGAGIHNTLEPGAFGLPVVFGPRFQKFEEARRLVEAGGFFSIKNEGELAATLARLGDPVFYEKASRAVTAFLEENRGATRVVLDFLKGRAGAF